MLCSAVFGAGEDVGSWAWESLQTCAKLWHAFELGVYVLMKFPEANTWVVATRTQTLLNKHFSLTPLILGVGR